MTEFQEDTEGQGPENTDAQGPAAEETKDPAAEETHTEMPKYKCHKEVHALKIKSIEMDEEKAAEDNCETDGSAMITPEDENHGPFKVDFNYLKKHDPQVGGYYVVYDGGYKSYSPAEAFESGYTLIQ